MIRLPNVDIVFPKPFENDRLHSANITPTRGSQCEDVFFWPKTHQKKLYKRQFNAHNIA
jgi:hypothetical protein